MQRAASGKGMLVCPLNWSNRGKINASMLLYWFKGKKKDKEKHSLFERMCQNGFKNPELL